MRSHKFLQRITALMLAVCLLCCGWSGAMARTIADIEADQKRLDEEDQQLDEQIAQLKGDISQKKEYAETLQKQIEVKQELINTARQDIEDLNARITVLTLTLDTAQEEIQATLDQFKERLVALYKAGNVSTLEILLNSTSFSDFTMRSQLLETMSRRDQAMMNQISDFIEETQAVREECEASKKKVAELKKDLEKQEQELNVLYEENAAALADLEEAQEEAEARQAEIERERQENDAEIERIIEEERKRREEEERRRQEALAAAQQSGGGTADGGYIPTGGSGGVEGFHPIWPLPGVTYISAGFNGYPGHKGLDIAGKWGTPVVAAESGTVIAANDYDSWGMSWGYYVLIYHNGTFTTRYAHLSGLTVSIGQYVEQGQIVGYEGATGNVTGPHLHFEVYQNGTRVNPMNFL